MNDLARAAAALVEAVEQNRRCGVCIGLSPSWDGHNASPPCIEYAKNEVRALLAPDSPKEAGGTSMSTNTPDGELTKKPTRFWVNSLGEWGHTYEDGEETVGGTVNLNGLATAKGKKVDDLTERDLKEAFDLRLWGDCAESEVIVFRMWEQANALQSSTFRFYGGINYAVEPFGPHLTMVTEYLIPDADTAKLESLNEHARKFGAEVGEMTTDTYTGYWQAKAPGSTSPGSSPQTHPGEWTYVPDPREGQTYTQHEVVFDIYGKSLQEVSVLMIGWLTATEHLSGDSVNVL